ncbi:MAG: alpha/beta fold hydrolase [Cyanobacteria bacterium P01_A01_bin.116]
MFSLWHLPVLATTLYQAIACYEDNQRKPPGQLIDVGGHRLHVLHLTASDPAIAAKPTVVIDHSLGGVEGYVFIKQIAEHAEVCLYDRAGYGWSEVSKRPANSDESVRSLDLALIKAGIRPPYILVGNSLGSYNMRLYAHRFPEKVAGMVLTDGLHEKALLNMPWSLRLLQAFFFSGFVMSILGAALGFVRVAANIGIFELLKPPLKDFPRSNLRPVVRSFYRPKHWFTMAREISQLDKSGQQLQAANDFGQLPIVNIKASHFLAPTRLTKCLPLAAADKLRNDMHTDLMALSTRCTQLPAAKSTHFVWIDQPEVIVNAVQLLLFRVAAIRPR